MLVILTYLMIHSVVYLLLILLRTVASGTKPKHDIKSISVEITELFVSYFFIPLYIFSLIPTFPRKSTQLLPSTTAERANKKVPILMVSGYALTGRSFTFLEQYLLNRGHCWTWKTSNPVLKDNIDDFVTRLHKNIMVIKQRSGQNKVHLIGHSMGGLISTKYMEKYGADSVHLGRLWLVLMLIIQVNRNK